MEAHVPGGSDDLTLVTPVSSALLLVCEWVQLLTVPCFLRDESGQHPVSQGWAGGSVSWKETRGEESWPGSESLVRVWTGD